MIACLRTGGRHPALMLPAFRFFRRSEGGRRAIPCLVDDWPSGEFASLCMRSERGWSLRRSLDEKGTARAFDRAVPSLLCAGDAAPEMNPDMGRLFLWDGTRMRPGVDLLRVAGPRPAPNLGDGNGLSRSIAPAD